MSNNTLILAITGLGSVLIAAFVAVVLLYQGDQALATAGLVTVAGLIIPQLIGLKVSTDVAAKVDANTAKTEQTHDLVNGQMTDFKAVLAELSAVRQQLTAATNLAAGITIGREQAGADATASEAV